jgi:DeoR/GlpR family transcriptional regulator of sugar metabolism
MIQASKKTVSLAISEKLNSVQRLSVCSIEDVDILVTELAVNDSKLEPYHLKGLHLL